MTKYFVLFLLFSFNTFAVEDVCCVLSTTSGDSVQTFSRIVSSTDCKGTYQGRKVCSALPDPDNTYCSSGSTPQDRCGKCGFFWTGKECLTKKPKTEDDKKNQPDKKDSSPAPIPSFSTIAPSPRPVAPTTTPSSGTTIQNPDNMGDNAIPDNGSAPAPRRMLRKGADTIDSGN